ncbi:16S rRNA (cytidine(1402)-2'-O)-methyltransferase [Halalkalibacterium ligniniphilum]|uniref:16S rRNA (cytidine(1402)-2'-O)-methyltransferase n=1 Tax=Halalkalibacterium ligniniphilum TaxID=1134413 RepID=UPI00034D8568|nr:16S rRNA (cytidine(1402)-2'-O)-methyltransferase [Halalkalibacterium ligniniphilum]
MKKQASFQAEERQGALYLVPTPIGNLEDMTFRAIRILKEADLVAAEDTRQTRKLFNHFDIETKLVSYHEHNKEASGRGLIDLVKDGATVALVSDAGMPAISDPGFELVQAAIEADLPVIPLPGANAALTALIASGLPTDSFSFFGFLPRQKKQKREALEQLRDQPSTLLFYEAPHRLKETLRLMHEVFGNRLICISRELTKKFEEFQRGTLEEALDWMEAGTIKGEFCLVVEGSTEEGKDEQTWWNPMTLEQHVEHYLILGMKPKEAIKQVAQDRNLPKRDVYQAYHQGD